MLSRKNSSVKSDLSQDGTFHGLWNKFFAHIFHDGVYKDIK